MAIQAKRISNTRPVKATNGAQFATLTTNGTMAISRTVMQQQKLRIDDSVLIEGLVAGDVGLTPTLVGGENVYVFTKGHTAEKGGKSVGNRISDTNGKNIISSATLYAELGGNNDQRNNFAFGEAVYGFLELADGTFQPITADSPEDAGIVNAYVRTEVDGKVTIQLEETTWTVAEVKTEGQAIYPLAFVNSVDKMKKGKASTPGTKAVKGAAPAVDLEEEDEFEEA